MTALTIAAASEASDGTFGPTLASLPITFVPAGTQSPDVAVINGSSDWLAATRSAIEAGVPGVVVSNPGVADAAETWAIADLARARGTRVEFAEPYVGDPAFEVHRDELAAHLQGASVLILSETTRQLSRAEAVLRILRSARLLGGQAKIVSVTEAPTSVVVTGTVGEKMLLASSARTSVKPSLRVQALGYFKTVDLTLDGETQARPAEITVTSMAGANRLPTVYEGAERAAWRRVASALRRDVSDVSPLAEFAADLQQLAEL